MNIRSIALCALALPLGLGGVLGGAGTAAAQMKCNEIDVVDARYEYKNCRDTPVEITVRWSDPLGVAEKYQKYQFGKSEWKSIDGRTAAQKLQGKTLIGKITHTRILPG